MSLKKQALSGVKWTFVQQFGVQLVGFFVSVVLARLLAPEEFGLIAMISIFMGIGYSLLNSGLVDSLIRSKEVDEEDYASVFYFNLVVSLIVYAFVNFLAPYIADFYNQTILIPLIRWLSLTYIINAFAIVQQARLRKEMDFKTLSIIAIPSLIIAGIVGVTMAYLNYGVWSLVAFNMVNTFVNTIQLWMYSKWKPIWKFNLKKFKKHINFGYKLTISSILNVVFTNAYVVVIGKFFPVAQVGYYQRANSFQMYPVSVISAIMSKVTYPLFSKIQDDNVRLKSIYKKILQLNIFLLAPFLIVVGVLAEPIFRFVFSEKWLPAVPYFRIILIIGILYPIHEFNLNILNVKGRSDLFLTLEVVKKTIVVVVIFFSINFGILGLLYGSVICSLLDFFINTHYSGKFINYSAWEQIKDIIPIILLALITGVLVYIIDTFTKEILIYDFLRLLVSFIIATPFYLFLSYIFKISSLIEIINIIKNR